MFIMLSSIVRVVFNPQGAIKTTMKTKIPFQQLASTILPLLALFIVLTSPQTAAAATKRTLWAVNDSGPSMGSISVYDIDVGHQLDHTITTVSNVGDVRGAVASAKTDMFYVSYTGSAGPMIYALDMNTETIVWNKPISPGVDRLAISPDGQTLYVPTNEKNNYNFINEVDAATGNVLRQVVVGYRSHDTQYPLSGPVFQEIKATDGTGQYLYMIDPVTNNVTRVGPFQGIIGPYAVDSTSTNVVTSFVTSSGGFQVGNLKTGQIISASRPGGTIGHGIAWTPDQSEVWAVSASGVDVWNMSNPMAPTFSQALNLPDLPSAHWVTFDINGDYGYIANKYTGTVVEVFNVSTHTLATTIESSEEMIEVDYSGSLITQIGDQYGIGRKSSSSQDLPYHDAFAGGSAPGWSTYNGTWSASNSSYVNTAVDTGGDKAVTGSTAWSDYTLQGDVMIRSGGGDAGLAFRVTNPSNGANSFDGYYVGLHANGNLELGRESYGWTLLQAQTLPGGVSQNIWYHLTAQAVGCTLTVSAQPVGSTIVTGFSYIDSGCSFTTGEVGIRTYDAAAAWRDISVSSGGTTSTLPYYAPFASSASGWSTYAGTWSLSHEAYVNSFVDRQGDKAIGGPTSGNFTLAGDLKLTTSAGGAGFLLRATNPAVGVNSVDTYSLGVNSAGYIVIGKDDYGGWTRLATMPISFSPNSWYHVTGEVVGCQVTLTVQPAGSTVPVSVSVSDCSFSSGRVGVRSYNTSAAWRYVSVTPR